MILLVDNYDSFVHNLARYFRLLGQATEVIRSDQVSTALVARLAPQAIVISPGPKSPSEATSSVEVVRAFSGRIPILGVCLGHQAIAAAFGGRVVAAEPVHGRESTIEHCGEGIFQDLESPLRVARYHSLVVEPSSLPACLRATAHIELRGAGPSGVESRVIMALAHRDHPTVGVQFHPESVLTQQGSQLLTNFLSLAGLSATAPPSIVSHSPSG